MTVDINTVHKDGAPWKTVGKYSTFALADIKRSEFLEDPEIQVKIHLQGPENKMYFAVKTRFDPAPLEAAAKKEEKARRKKRLQKKRRKK
ncbi:hypothetical protein CL634_05710 [bacterium]|nr:hypothetical protein [bacterium]